MPRVLVIGSPGAGKSTLAAQLAAALGLPLVHLDQLFWSAGWEMRTEGEFAGLVREAIGRERWVIDGNYASNLRERMARADTVIYLDPPTRLCLWRVLKRIASGYGKVRPDMAAGCPERFDFEFLRYVASFRSKVRPLVEAILREFPDCVLIRCRTRRDTADAVAELTKSPDLSTA